MAEIVDCRHLICRNSFQQPVEIPNGSAYEIPAGVVLIQSHDLESAQVVRQTHHGLAMLF